MGAAVQVRSGRDGRWILLRRGVDARRSFFVFRLLRVVHARGRGATDTHQPTNQELVKCKIQVQNATKSGAATTGIHGEELFRGPVDVVVKTLRKEGIQGLYRGHTACLLRELPGNFAWFGVYESCLRFVQERFGYKDRADVPLHLKALSGSVGGVFYWAVPYPLDTVKVRSLLSLGPHIAAAPPGNVVALTPPPRACCNPTPATPAGASRACGAASTRRRAPAASTRAWR